MNEIYLAVDGDDIGHRLEYFMLVNQRDSLIEFSKAVKNAMNWLEEKLIDEFNAQILFNGGDNLLACLPLDRLSPENLSDMRSKFNHLSSSTLSVGLGSSPRQAYFALKLAKTSGKNRVCQFQDLVNE